MKRLGELMQHTATPDEREALEAVLEAAHAWKAGDLDLDGVRSVCGGLDRWHAMRAATIDSDDQKLLIALTDALTHQRNSSRGFMSKHGYVSYEEVNEGRARIFTNWKGEEVMVWPLYFMDGEPYYPPVHIEPGEERRKVEAEMNRRYSEYRRAKGRAG